MEPLKKSHPLVGLGVMFTAALLLATITYAAPTQPKTGVWTVPENAKNGEKVELNALVYNSETKTVTMSVLFATPTDELATITLTLPAGSAKTATSDWTVPSEQTTVKASVIKAVDASQKVVPDMLGPIGSVTIGMPVKSTFSLGNFNISTKTWFGTMLSFIEPWRKAQAVKYAALRDATRKELNIDTVVDITNRFNAPDAPALPGQAKQPTPAQQAFPIGKYATLLFASAVAALFASSTIFYIAAICVILLLFRFFIRLFT